MRKVAIVILIMLVASAAQASTPQISWSPAQALVDEAIKRFDRCDVGEGLRLGHAALDVITPAAIPDRLVALLSAMDLAYDNSPPTDSPYFQRKCWKKIYASEEKQLEVLLYAYKLSYSSGKGWIYRQISPLLFRLATVLARPQYADQKNKYLALDAAERAYCAESIYLKKESQSIILYRRYLAAGGHDLWLALQANGVRPRQVGGPYQKSASERRENLGIEASWAGRNDRVYIAMRNYKGVGDVVAGALSAVGLGFAVGFVPGAVADEYLYDPWRRENRHRIQKCYYLLQEMEK